MNPVPRKPIRTDLEKEVRCTSRFANCRCKLQSGHRGAHDAGKVDGVEMKWGGKVYKR